MLENFNVPQENVLEDKQDVMVIKIVRMDQMKPVTVINIVQQMTSTGVMTTNV